MTDRNDELDELTRRIADVLRQEIRSELGLREGEELRIIWERIARNIVSVLPTPDIDKVAEAIWAGNNEPMPWAYPWQREEESVKNHYRAVARAAVEAMGDHPLEGELDAR